MPRIFQRKKIRVFRVHPCPQNTMSDVVIKAEGLGKKYAIEPMYGIIETMTDIRIRNCSAIGGTHLLSERRGSGKPAV
jgi:hypothetical protein